MSNEIEYDGKDYTVDGKKVPRAALEQAEAEHRARKKREEREAQEEYERKMMAVPDKPDDIKLGPGNVVLGGKEIKCGTCGGRCVMHWSDESGQLYHVCEGCKRKFKFHDPKNWRAETLTINREQVSRLIAWFKSYAKAGLETPPDTWLEAELRQFKG